MRIEDTGLTDERLQRVRKWIVDDLKPNSDNLFGLFTTAQIQRWSDEDLQFRIDVTYTGLVNAYNDHISFDAEWRWSRIACHYVQFCDEMERRANEL